MSVEEESSEAKVSGEAQEEEVGEEAEEGNEQEAEGDNFNGLVDEGEEEGVVGVYNANDVVSSSLDEMQLPEDVCDQVIETWNIFLRTAESREQAGDAIFSALFETAPSLQSLFKSPRAVFVMRFMNGMNQLVNSLKDPKGLKVLTETFGFQHLDFDVTVPRVVVFRDSFLDLFALELGQKFCRKAKDGWATMLNYVGGAFIFVRVKYADRLKILASSWATANNTSNTEEEFGAVAEEGAEEGAGEEGEEGASGELKNDKLKGNSGQASAEQSGGSGEAGRNAKNTAVPTTFNEMFIFNAAVMGFSNNTWMSEVLNSFDAIVRNVSNTYRLQEESDVLSLRIAKCKDSTINLGEYKAVLLASLRSLVPKDWNSAHEVAWSWLWENVERMLKALFGKSAIREKALTKLFNELDDRDQEYMRREVYVKFFALAPAGQDHFKQSATRLHFLSGKVMSMTLDMYTQPKVMIDNLSAIGLRHVGYGVPTDLFGPYVTACVQVVREVTTEDIAEESFRWSLSLMSRVLNRVVGEGSTIVMKAINVNSGKQLKKAVGCAPRGKRALWMLNIQVGTQSISPLLWSIETGSIEAAHAIVTDLLTFRADRDRYYYGMDTLFERHADIIKRLCVDAPGLLPVMLDGLIWRSRTTEKGMRRVNYYVKHLLVDAHGGFSKTIEWVTETKDPKLVCHPVLSLVTDMVWGRIAMRSFLLGKTWFLFTLCIFILSQSILKHVADDPTDRSAEAPIEIRIITCACRLFIYIFSLGQAIIVHVKHILTDISNKNFVKVACIKLPASLFQWQEAASLFLTVMLMFMLITEPILHCLDSKTAEVVLSENCPAVQDVIVAYSVFSTIAMLLYFSLLVDLSVLSTRISAFALVCFRVLSEVALFLFGLTFLVVAFASAISSLQHGISNFVGIPQAALSLYKITFGMLDGTMFDELQDEAAVFAMVLVYIITTVVFLMNLLIAQLNCAYQATYQDMLGYARLNRGKIVTETMPTVSKSRWDTFIGSLKLDDCVEFGEGDIGIPGGIQVLEPASQNITTQDMIHRFGGSTSQASPWPEEENLEESEDRFDRMEKMMERSLKKISTRRGGKGAKGSALTGSDSSAIDEDVSGSAHDSVEQ